MKKACRGHRKDVPTFRMVIFRQPLGDSELRRLVERLRDGLQPGHHDDHVIHSINAKRLFQVKAYIFVEKFQFSLMPGNLIFL